MSPGSVDRDEGKQRQGLALVVCTCLTVVAAAGACGMEAGEICEGSLAALLAVGFFGSEGCWVCV